MKPNSYVSLALLSIFGWTNNALAQAETGSIVGQVSDANSDTILKGVIISIQENGKSTASDQRGNFAFSGLQPGQYKLNFSYIGYDSKTQTVQVTADQVARLNMELGTEIVELDTFVVRGQAIGQARALNRQRSSLGLSNFVSADAVGRFPDQNVAESLQRLPGLSIEKDQGEGRFVSIRGIDPNLSNVSIDGVVLPAPEGESRSVALDVIPNDILETIQVSKVITPDMDADAIGGSINIETKSALDRSERIFSGSVQGHYNDLIDKTSGKVEFTYGDLFGKNKDMAYLISVSYQERKMGSDNAEADNWEEDGASGFYFPKEIEFRQYDVTRERFAISSGLEYQPDDERYYYIRAIYNYFSDDENRYRWVLVPEDGTPTLTSSRAGTITGAQATTRDIKDRFEEQEIWAITIGGESTINDWELDYSATFAHAEENEPDRLDTEFEYEAAHDFAYNYSQRGGQVPLISGGSAAIYDGANYAFKEAVVENNLAEEDEYTFQVNAKKDMELMGLPALFKTGLKYRDKTKKLDVRNDIYEDGTFSLADVAANDTDFAFGKGPDGSYLRGNSGAARGFFNTQLGDGTLTRDDEKSDYESLANDYESEEDIFAAYLMGTVEKDAWTVTAGARIEHTEFTSKGYSITDEDPATATWVEQSKDYTDVMPAVVLRYDRSENMIFRGSWTNTLARPIFEHSANRIALNSVDSEAEVGNPDLDPYKSMNWDASVEYYAENLGIVAVSFFYKDIDDFIYQYEDPNGYTDLLGNFYNDLTTFRNGEDASVYGIELTWQQQLSKFSFALDGFGIFATAIYSDSEAEIEGGREIPLPKHSEEVYTVGFTFEKYDFFFRIAGTQRSAYLDAIGGSQEEDEYIDDNFQWDITSAYDINENFQIFAQFINIYDEPKYSYYGQSDRVRQYEEYSWAANTGVKWKF